MCSISGLAGVVGRRIDLLVAYLEAIRWVFLLKIYLCTVVIVALSLKEFDGSLFIHFSDMMTPLFSYTGDFANAKLVQVTSSKIVLTTQNNGIIVLNSSAQHEKTLDVGQGKAVSVLRAKCTNNVYAAMFRSDDFSSTNSETYAFRLRVFNLKTGYVNNSLQLCLEWTDTKGGSCIP